MQEDLTAAALAFPAIAAIAQRNVYWKRRPQGTGLSALVMHRVHGRALYTMDGRVKLSPFVVQFDCRGATYADAVALSRAVIGLLDTLTARPFRGAFLRQIRDHDEADDGPVSSPSAEDFLVSLDAQVWHLAA